MKLTLWSAVALALLCPLSSGQLDKDGDLIAYPFDNCPNVSNPSQLDSDLDGKGDACDQLDIGPGGFTLTPSDPSSLIYFLVASGTPCIDCPPNGFPLPGTGPPSVILPLVPDITFSPFCCNSTQFFSISPSLNRNVSDSCSDCSY